MYAMKERLVETDAERRLRVLIRDTIEEVLREHLPKPTRMEISLGVVPVASLDLSVRLRNALWHLPRGLTIEGLTRMTAKDLMCLSGFGQVCLQELRARMAEMGVTLSNEPPTTNHNNAS